LQGIRFACSSAEIERQANLPDFTGDRNAALKRGSGPGVKKSSSLGQRRSGEVIYGLFFVSIMLNNGFVCR
jgi:hypothetical protein